mgnify:FL=1
MEKETQLDSEISIKEKFKALSPKEKYSYIWEYYKIHMLMKNTSMRKYHKICLKISPL